MNGTITEPKPAGPGSYYGQISPGGAWMWNGTGQPGDAWIPNPSASSPPGVEPQLGVSAQAYPPPFPAWPPSSGGYPVTTPEMGPITNPYPYGSTQQSNISTALPSPPYNAIKYPQRYGVAMSGQNQGPGYGLPVMTKPWEVGPIKADPSISQIHPIPIIGPGPQGTPPY